MTHNSHGETIKLYFTRLKYGSYIWWIQGHAKMGVHDNKMAQPKGHSQDTNNCCKCWISKKGGVYMPLLTRLWQLDILIGWEPWGHVRT